MNANGVVISLHTLGATVRLDDGSLASVPATEVARHRDRLTVSFARHEALTFAIERRGRHAVAHLDGPAPQALEVPRLHDDGFEAMMNTYLKSVEEHEPPDRPPPAERHFIRKKRRAAFFESRHRET